MAAPSLLTTTNKNRCTAAPENNHGRVAQSRLSSRQRACAKMRGPVDRGRRPLFNIETQNFARYCSSLGLSLSLRSGGPHVHGAIAPRFKRS